MAQPAELPAGPNRDIVARECTACHDLTMVLGEAGTSPDDWGDIVGEMISYGARIDPDDRAKIVEYLSRFLGPGSEKPAGR